MGAGTDRGGDRIERAALSISDYLLTENGAYDIITGDYDLREFVAERDPKTIALNYSEYIAGADGLTYSYYQQLVEILGEPYVSRFVSSEKLITDFRSRRVASEIAAFAQLGDISRRIAERALSNEVITPGVTTLEDVAWWMKEQFLPRAADTLTYPEWVRSGKKDCLAYAKERMDEILSTHTVSIPLSEEQDNKIEAILSEARDYYQSKGLL